MLPYGRTLDSGPLFKCTFLGSMPNSVAESASCCDAVMVVKKCNEEMLVNTQSALWEKFDSYCRVMDKMFWITP